MQKKPQFVSDCISTDYLGEIPILDLQLNILKSEKNRKH